MTADPDRDEPGRRSFLRLAGAGAAGATMATLAAAPAAGATEETPFWRSLTEPGWHGRDQRSVAGDGGTDDTAAIQRVFDRIAKPSTGVSGAYLAVPPGEYVLRDTVVIDRFAGVIQGAGIGHTPQSRYAPGLGSAFRWEGPAGKPMFRVSNSSKAAFRDLRFEGRTAEPPSAGLNFHYADPDEAGTNAELAVQDCHFGVWPWAHDGVNEGIMLAGIHIGGSNRNNDQFRIDRCSFAGRSSRATWGVKIDSSQSVWGSLGDCFFDRVRTGIETSASTTLVNPQFNGCGTDLDIRSTARVDLVGWQSEKSGRLARLDTPSSLVARGGVCLVRAKEMRGGSPLIDAHPSSSRQTISLSDMAFDFVGYARTGDRPDIRFGAPAGFATSGGFYVRVHDCIGIVAGQANLITPMETPGSRGTVEWHSRAGQIHQFRNELRGDGRPGSRRALDTSVWDPPLAGAS